MSYSDADKQWINDKALEISLERNWPLLRARVEATVQFHELPSRPKAEVIRLWGTLETLDFAN